MCCYHNENLGRLSELRESRIKRVLKTSNKGNPSHWSCEEMDCEIFAVYLKSRDADGRLPSFQDLSSEEPPSYHHVKRYWGMECHESIEIWRGLDAARSVRPLVENRSWMIGITSWTRTNQTSGLTAGWTSSQAETSNSNVSMQRAPTLRQTKIHCVIEIVWLWKLRLKYGF